MTKTYRDFFKTPELLLSCPVYDTSTGKTMRIGSAIFVMPGLFLTAKHNFEAWQARGLGIDHGYDIDQFPAGSPISFEVDIVHYSSLGRIVWHVESIGAIPGYDIAILMCESGPKYLTDLVNKHGFPGMSIGFDMHAPKIGESVHALGHPGTDVAAAKLEDVPPEPLLKSPGVVEDLHLEGAGIMVKTAALQISNEVRPGMSGGPVIHNGQYVCGLISTGIDPSDDYPHHTTFLSLLWEAFSTPVTSKLFDANGKVRTLTLIEAASENFLTVRGAEHISRKNDRLIWNADAPGCKDCPYKSTL